MRAKLTSVTRKGGIKSKGAESAEEDKYAVARDETRRNELKIAGREDVCLPVFEKVFFSPSLIIRLTIIFNDFAIS